MTSPNLPGHQRREVEELVQDLPSRPPQIVFNEPWEVRAFAIAVAAHKTGHYPWSDFQQALVASIRTWEASGPQVGDPPWSYYEHWLNALEAVLDNHGAVAPGAVDRRTQEVLAAPPNRNHHEAQFEPVAVDPAIRSCQGES
jgi:nitrile hydratase accessory protein